MTLYEASVPAFRNVLASLGTILGKAAAHCEATGTGPAALLATRLAPDMLPLTRQVQIACDNAKLAPYRLAGLPYPAQPDTETTLPELQARATATLALLAHLTPEHFEGAEARTIAFKIGGHQLEFTPIGYLTRFALPNTYFHLTAAYAILRHCGVPLVKRDYLPQLPAPAA